MTKWIGVIAVALAATVVVWFSVLMASGSTAVQLALVMFGGVVIVSVAYAIAILRGRRQVAAILAVVGAVLSIFTPAVVIDLPLFLVAVVAAAAEERRSRIGPDAD